MSSVWILSIEFHGPPFYLLDVSTESLTRSGLGYRCHHFHHTNSTAISTTTMLGHRRSQDTPFSHYHYFIIIIIRKLFHCYYHSAANHARFRTIVHKKMLDIEW